MKQVKIEYEKCRKKMPHRPPDEIDFGLGFRAGLDWALSRIKDGSISYEQGHIEIEEELQ